MADNKQERVVPLPERPQGVVVSKRKDTQPEARRGGRPLLISFLLLVLLPAVLGAIYYASIASDRYVSSAGFAVRGMDGGGSSDLLGTFTGLASTGSTTSDSYILLKYLKSRDLVERLQEHLDLRAIYAREDTDFLSRLGPEQSIENLVDYWSRQVTTSFDNTAGIITFEVAAFAPEDALRIAQLALEFSRDLVNELSSQARSDAVAFAEAEVIRAETRLGVALEQVRLFRQDENSIDPARSAQIQIELIGGLERQLIDVRARIATLSGSVDADSPSMRSLVRQAEALEQQIAERQTAISNNTVSEGVDTASLSSQLATYETLEVERNFAQQSYASALSSLETARVEAGRQQRYLAVYNSPALAEYARYPNRVLNSVLIFAVLALVWAIGSLIVAAVRDHLS